MANLGSTLIDPGLRRRIALARVGHLATSDGTRPTVVPVCFVLLGDTLYQAIDAKPKSVGAGQLRRVKNIQANPNVAVVIDHYVEDWRRLWWVLLQGHARLLATGPEQERAIKLLRRKYIQYRRTTPLTSNALVIALDVARLRYWQANRPVR